MAKILKQNNGRFLSAFTFDKGEFKFTWTRDQREARRFENNDPIAETFAAKSGARVITLEGKK